ncbi:hypothetical protein [Streptomyces sp. WG7]
MRLTPHEGQRPLDHMAADAARRWRERAALPDHSEAMAPTALGAAHRPRG